MQKRNEKKKKLVCGRNGNLMISSVLHTAGTSSDMPKCHHLPKEKRKRKGKEKRGKLSQSFRKNLGVFVVVLYMNKKEPKENFLEKGLTRIRTGVTRSFSISVHCRTFSKSGMLTTTS